MNDIRNFVAMRARDKITLSHSIEMFTLDG